MGNSNVTTNRKILEHEVLDTHNDSKKPEKNLIKIIKNKSFPYILKAKIGSGISSTCYTAISLKHPNKKFAVKILSKLIKTNCRLFEKETKILTLLKNVPGVIQLIESCEDEDNYYLIFELGSTDLLTYTLKYYLNEITTKKLIKNILKTIEILHLNDIAHRDLKLENIVIVPGSDNLKIIDFGVSVAVQNKEIYDDLVGTIHYLSPERLKKFYYGWECKASDIWAIGVICYELLTRRRCFHGNNVHEINTKISSGIWRWPTDCQVSAQGKHFVQALLDTNPRTRLTIREALNHPWLLNDVDEIKENESFNDSPDSQYDDSHHHHQINYDSSMNQILSTKKIKVKKNSNHNNKNEKKLKNTIQKNKKTIQIMNSF